MKLMNDKVFVLQYVLFKVNSIIFIMKRIILEISDANARRWEALPQEDRDEITRWFERFIPESPEAEKAAMQTVNEPPANYGDTVLKKQKEQDRRQQKKDFIAYLDQLREDMVKKGLTQEILDEILSDEE